MPAAMVGTEASIAAARAAEVAKLGSAGPARIDNLMRVMDGKRSWRRQKFAGHREAGRGLGRILRQAGDARRWLILASASRLAGR